MDTPTESTVETTATPADTTPSDAGPDQAAIDAQAKADADAAQADADAAAQADADAAEQRRLDAEQADADAAAAQAETDKLNADRPDAAIVVATTAEDGGPDNAAKSPIPEGAATGDAVSQVRRGEVDGVTITDADTPHDWQPGDVLLSVDPFVTVMRGAAAQELRDNALPA